ncbi:acetate--CoA ligase family protein [Jatrophihabitans cynanchi]|uniref:Acetate--CoA ligase family protein n=1 Tax=Jatrophihabitans cynanchi TaxID=2944128 RepID=A0ABY7K124_9ACTN|nr:acetate--CoA ligase family protein [Jatrophihabitans sp. SB3-54]WAX58369.1 acetate--CoA ligase family protein [Jatrophihabitans sp. SB3-54]
MIDPATTEAVRSLLAPASVAVVGASSRLESMSGASLVNLVDHGYRGRIVAVNPRHETLCGVPCVPTLDALGEPVDTLVVVTPAAVVPDVLRAAKGRASSATVVTAGFGALGLQQDLEDAIAASGLRILGPNTAGLINVAAAYCPRAARNQLREFRTGPVALVTQSGGLGNVVFNRAQAAGLGIGYSVATGDAIDLSVWDFVDFALADPGLTTVMLAIESGIDPDRLIASSAMALEHGKSLLLLAMGVGDVARQAAATHTGAVAGSHDVELAVARELGVTVVDDVDALWQAAAALARWDMRAPLSGRRSLGVISISGGIGVAAADAAEHAGFELPALDPEDEARISSMLSLGRAGNPLDPTGEMLTKPELFREVVQVFDRKGRYDGILVALPTLQDVAAHQVIPPLLAGLGGREGLAGRVLVSTYLAGNESETARRLLEDAGVLTLDGLPQAVSALHAVFDRWELAGGHAADRLAAARRWTLSPREPGAVLGYIDSRRVLQQIGVPLVEAVVVHDEGDVREAFAQLGPRVVLKASSAATPHKFKAGLVKLGITEADGAVRAWEHLADRGATLPDFDGVVCERAAVDGLDLLVGGVAEPRFGPVVGIGTGGWFAESMGDTTLLPAPLSEGAVSRALRRTLPGGLLAEDRPSVFAALVETVARISAAFAATATIAGFDVNPVRIDTDGGISALDALVIESAPSAVIH